MGLLMSRAGRTRAIRGRTTARRIVAAGVCAVTIVALAACGSASGTTETASGSNSASGTEAAAAKAAIASVTDQATPFPVSEPLTEKLPAGKKFAFFQCGTPGCSLASKSFKAAVAAIGGTFSEVPAGTTATTSQSAAATVLAMKPDVAFLTVDPALYGDGLKKLADAGIKVISISVVKDVKPYGVTFNYIGAPQIEKDGRLMANWVIAKAGGNADVVFYGMPAFDYAIYLQKAFDEEMKKNCPNCKVRTVPVDPATIGTTAPTRVVADLQANPSTKVAVFASLQIAQGLPAAMSAAGLSGITTMGRGPAPANLGDIKSGALTGALTLDLNLSGWICVDAAARLLQGQQPTANETAGALVEQYLEQKDITFDPTNGWVGYPDYKERFAKLWHVG